MQEPRVFSVIRGLLASEYESEKKRNKYEYPLDEIAMIEFGKVLRHINGCVITFRNGDVASFGMSDKEFRKWSEIILGLIEGVGN